MRRSAFPLTFALYATLALTHCTVPDVDLDGRPCPCAEGYVCDVLSNTCVRPGADSGAPDANAPDATTPDGGGRDAAPDSTSLDSAVADATVPDGAADADTGPGCFRDDFDAPSLPGWTTFAGDWSQRDGEAIQTDPELTLSFMYADATAGTTDFRARTRMRQLSGAFGGALEICFRTNPSDPVEQYFCNWEPNAAQMVLMRGNPETGTFVLDERNLDLEEDPGWDPNATFTMVVEVRGDSFRCWLEEVPGTMMSGSDTSYAAGAVGFKTYRMAGAYEFIEVCPLP